MTLSVLTGAVLGAQGQLATCLPAKHVPEGGIRLPLKGEQGLEQLSPLPGAWVSVSRWQDRGLNPAALRPELFPA